MTPDHVLSSHHHIPVLLNIIECYVLLCFQHLLTSVSVGRPPMIKTDPILHSTCWYMHSLQLFIPLLHLFPPSFVQAISDGGHLALRVCSLFYLHFICCRPDFVALLNIQCQWHLSQHYPSLNIVNNKSNLKTIFPVSSKFVTVESLFSKQLWDHFCDKWTTTALPRSILHKILGNFYQPRGILHAQGKSKKKNHTILSPLVHICNISSSSIQGHLHQFSHLFWFYAVVIICHVIGGQSKHYYNRDQVILFNYTKFKQIQLLVMN